MTGINIARSHPTAPPAIRIYGLGDLGAALRAAAGLTCPLTVISFPGAAGSAGPLWFRALIEAGRTDFPTVPLTAILDCADQPGHALGALRTGLRHILLSGPSASIDRVSAIAHRQGVTLFGAAGPILDFRGCRDAERAICDWLALNPQSNRPDIANTPVNGYSGPHSE